MGEGKGMLGIVWALAVVFSADIFTCGARLALKIGQGTVRDRVRVRARVGVRVRGRLGLGLDFGLGSGLG